jgi:tetratricopeptide (TPR) repeat protein
LSKSGAVGGMEVNQKISKFGHPACHYLIGLSHYLEFYQKRPEQLRILRILSESELNLESKRDLLRVFFDLELSEEALGIAKKWVDHQPENWTSQVALALAYEQNGMLKFAKETIEKAEGLPGFKTNGTVDQIKEAIRRIA